MLKNLGKPKPLFWLVCQKINSLVDVVGFGKTIALLSKSLNPLYDSDWFKNLLSVLCLFIKSWRNDEKFYF